MSAAFRKPINAVTRLCAVLGRPIQHSASPAMQNAGMAALGLNWRYLACEVAPEDLAAAIRGARAMHFLGLNLTVPHKLLAMSLVDDLDLSAETWGAVNTIRFEAEDPAGTWRPLAELSELRGPVRSRGFNTDANAIVRSISEDLAIEPRGARVLLLGAGGAGRTAALRLADEGVCALWLINRTEEKAAELAREVADRFPAVEVQVGYPDSAVEIILNATSLGLKAGDGLPLDIGRFPLNRADVVFDMIYRPSETPLLHAARQAGCRTANGLGMLLYQGAAALELWSGCPAPVEVMRSALQHEIYGPKPDSESNAP